MPTPETLAAQDPAQVALARVIAPKLSIADLDQIATQLYTRAAYLEQLAAHLAGFQEDSAAGVRGEAEAVRELAQRLIKAKVEAALA